MKPEVQAMYEESSAFMRWQDATAKAQRLGNSPEAVEAWREALYFKSKLPPEMVARLEQERLARAAG